ncbi:MAG TPA: zinc ribbon domain-containing protein [Candidatus Binatia bacterium]|nr:zinc ribbon domain-containing protein [Candidatus Binatia bacterium]
MFCSHCAASLVPDAEFCVKCGAPVDILLYNTLTPPTENHPAPAIGLEATREAPPYAAFVSMALGMGLCLSVLAFNAAHNLAQGVWRVSLFSIISAVLAVVLMIRMPVTWRKVETQPDQDGSNNKLLRRSAFFVLIFVVTAALVGAKIGKDGKETGQLIDDFHQMSLIGDRISKARNSVEPNVPAHIAMYKQIEPDVQAFGVVLKRIRRELPSYDEKFPEHHETTLKNIDTVNISLKRASLLEQQISVAREIESLDPAPRWQAWEQRMLPLLDAESALEKD